MGRYIKLEDACTEIYKSEFLTDNNKSWAVEAINKASAIDLPTVNGAIVFPPCNIGDTAYMVTNTGNIKNLTVTGIDIKLRKNETEIICSAEYELDGLPCKIAIVPSKIGEIYFFNLEAAQRKAETVVISKQEVIPSEIKDKRHAAEQRYTEALKMSIASGQADKIINSPKAQALLELERTVLEGKVND